MRPFAALKTFLLVTDLKVFLLGTVLLAIFLRLAVVAFLIHDAASQAININDFGWESWEMGWTARSIFLGHGFSSPFLPTNTGPTALVPPLYPYFLAGVFKLLGLYTLKSAFAVLGFNSICSALTCLPLYLLTRNALTERAGRIAAFGWAVYPFSIYFSADRVWDYALTALLFSCCLLMAQRLHLRGRLAWAGFGLLYGVAVLSNPSIVSMLPVLLLIALFKVWRVGGAWFTKGLIASLAFIAVCTPWTIRNQRVMHASFFMRDGFWLEFYAGNNGDTHESNSAFAHPASNPAEMVKYEQMGEIAYMASKHDLAVDFVKHHPGFFAVATVRRVVRFWTGFWSFSPSYLKYEPFDLPNVPFCLVLIWALQRGIRRWWRENPGSLVPYLCALILFPLPYYLTHASMDYRQPLEPMIIVLVTVGFFGTGSDRQTEPDQSEFELQNEQEPVLA
ncbi:ArnT family glycosyltransferase [Granulicella rosea]|nr:glycosyltransferase family 39 protein [Granulicella rosea]